tara:strand:- start:1801 stop:2745 length:945 start_codon:yes stop_codon:yes gene_type:complete
MKNLVYIQNNENKINTNSLESLVAMQEIAAKNNEEVYAITFNKDIAEQLTKYKIDKIIFINNQELNSYNPQYYLSVFEKLNAEFSPKLFCFGHSYETRDWVPRLSARLDIPFISDCTGYQTENGLSFTRPIYQAKLNEKIELKSNGIVSFQAGTFNIENLESGNSTIEEKSIDLTSTKITIRPGEKFKESAGGVDLTSAEIIVSVGRGLSKEENIPMAEGLAEKLNAQIGASRPVVDAGWLDHSRQIGSSGQTVSPKLYFSLGVSGAIQHLVGMKGSKNIIAINKDPNAPIFEIADYAVVGDLFEIIPKLTENL